jgi:hypothetical protein
MWSDRHRPSAREYHRPAVSLFLVSEARQGGDPQCVMDHDQRADDEHRDADYRPPFDPSGRRSLLLPMLPRVVRTTRSSSACALMHRLFAGCAHFREMVGFEQKHDPDAEQHASHKADQEAEKEFSSHRGDHGEPDAPLLIIEGGAGALRLLSTYQKRAALAMDQSSSGARKGRPARPARADKVPYFPAFLPRSWLSRCRRSRCMRMCAASAEVFASAMARSKAVRASSLRPSCIRNAPRTPKK